MKKTPRIEPAPLKFPEGGALKAAADKRKTSLEQKLQAHDLTSSIKRQQIIDSHSKGK